MSGKWARPILILMLLAAMLPLTMGQGAAAGLPIDFSPGPVPLPESYGDLTYEDETLSVRIEEKRIFNTNVWIAYIKIAHASQLRTLAARGFDSRQVVSGKVMAQRANAVLAINGDYFSYENTGYMVRQGKTYRKLPGGVRDVLLIDEEGNFHIDLGATEESLSKFDMERMVNTFNFGPALVVDGQRVETFIDNRNAAFKQRQRMCFAQTGPLTYMCIATGGAGRGSAGMTLEQISIVAYDLGAVCAYNLDGGESVMMYFGAEKINDPTNSGTRDISDIIYFASAHGQAGE